MSRAGDQARSVRELLQQNFEECNALQSSIADLIKEGSKKQKEVEQLSKDYSAKSKLLDRTLHKLAAVTKEMPKLKIRKRDFDRKEAKAQRGEEKIEELQEELKVASKRLKKADSEVNDLWREVLVREGAEEEKEELEKLVEVLRQENEEKLRDISQLRAKKKRILTLKETMIAKIRAENQAEIEEWMESSALLEEEIGTSKKDADSLQETIQELQSKTIETFDGRYSDAMRQFCMELINNGNVSRRKVPIVIRAVLSSLVGKLPSRIPSQALLSSRIMLEARYIANKQV